MVKNNEDSGSFKRRNFLRATSVTTFGTVGMEPVGAKQNDAYGRVSFVEAGLYHRTALPEVDGGFAFVHIDDLLDHWVDESEKELYLRGTADESTKQVFRANSHVSKFVGYHSPPTSIDRHRTKVVTTELGRAYRRTRGLWTAEEYERPSLDIDSPGRSGNHAVVVTSDEQQFEIEPRTSKSVELEPRTVDATVEKATGETVQDESIPEPRRAQRIEKRVETVTITPVVAVRNYGKLDVVAGPR